MKEKKSRSVNTYSDWEGKIGIRSSKGSSGVQYNDPDDPKKLLYLDKGGTVNQKQHPSH